jgi:hypothetical protein
MAEVKALLEDIDNKLYLVTRIIVAVFYIRREVELETSLAGVLLSQGPQEAVRFSKERMSCFHRTTAAQPQETPTPHK